MSFTLRPLTSPDIPICAHLVGLAFTTDRQTQFKASSPNNPYNHAEGMQSALEHWLSRPPGTIELTLAVDNVSQEIIGWVAWSSRGFDPDEAERHIIENLNAGCPVALNVEGVRGVAPRAEPGLLADGSRSSRERLEEYTSADLQHFMKTLMPFASKCMFVSSIVVHPSHQGRGVGRALVRKGTERADQEDVCAWVHASEGAAGMFERCGFEEVRRLEVDLDEWNSEGAVPPEGGRWGGYVLRYMLRRPVSV